MTGPLIHAGSTFEDPQFKLSPEWEAHRGGWQIRNNEWNVEIAGYDGEVVITLLWSSRQDGKTEWMLVKIEVDGPLTYKKGVTTYEFRDEPGVELPPVVNPTLKSWME